MNRVYIYLSFLVYCLSMSASVKTFSRVVIEENIRKTMGEMYKCFKLDKNTNRIAPKMVVE